MEIIDNFCLSIGMGVNYENFKLWLSSGISDDGKTHISQTLQKKKNTSNLGHIWVFPSNQTTLPRISTILYTISTNDYKDRK